MEFLQRTKLLFGEEGLRRLQAARVAVFGVGGVGSYALEALARSGIGTLDIFDNDIVTKSNINRQLIALNSNIGIKKVDAAKSRINDINENATVNAHCIFYSQENSQDIDYKSFDYIVDAIDSISSKIELVVNAKRSGVPIISCMGMANKVQPQMVEVADLFSTSVCPIAKIMRNQLKKLGIDKLKVVYSKETALKPIIDNSLNNCEQQKSPLGSTAFVPAVAGLIMAGVVVNELIK